MIRVLNVTDYESPGRRFHGLSMAPNLRSRGIESSHVIRTRDTADPAIGSFDETWAAEINSMLGRVESETSLQSVLHSGAKQLMRMPEFEEADLVHLHLVHTGYFSIGDLPELTAKKPTIWTLHDPWAFTGHCIYPFDCTGWMTGCGNCPDLSIPFAMKEDNTAFMFRYKKRFISGANFEVIVASRWMAEMAAASPLFQNKLTHEVPFGLDLTFFAPRAVKPLRERYGIPADAVVISFRAEVNRFKGFEYILAMLERLHSDKPLCLLTMSSARLPESLAERFQIVELGWVNDESIVRDVFVASDIFLMPSTVEAFGVMAIEAMACGVPVICFDGTSVPDVINAPEIGLSVPMRDADALYAATQHLIASPGERRRRGLLGRAFAEKHYDENRQADVMAEVYKNAVNRRSAGGATAVSNVPIGTSADPRVSIVIPVYNGSNFLKEAVDSALAQTWPNIEIIVVNDGSEDGGATDAIARSYGERIQYLTKKNGGVASALNLGLSAMNGDIFCWLSHDDRHHPGKTSVQVSDWKRHGRQNELLYTDYQIIDAGGRVISPGPLDHEMLVKKPLYGLLRGLVHGCTTFIPRSVVDAVGPFDETLPTTQDYDWFCRISKKYPIRHMRGVMVDSRSHGAQDSKKPSHIAEATQFWLRMVGDIDRESRIALEGSEEEFVQNMATFLEKNRLGDAAELIRRGNGASFA